MGQPRSEVSFAKPCNVAHNNVAKLALLADRGDTNICTRVREHETHRQLWLTNELVEDSFVRTS